jgi:glycosyltransferase involved in cell wall biosynthesis
MPEVTVIIPTYNRARYIGSTIETVQQQTFADWELFIVDDGSTDNTAEVVAGYLGDKRIHYIKQQNNERAVTRNKGIEESSSPYIAFLDADDLWHPEKLAKQLQAIKAQPDAGLCYTLTDDIDPDGKRLHKTGRSHPYSGRVFDQLLRSNFIRISSVLVGRASLERVGSFDTDVALLGGEDWDLWLRIARQYSVCLVREELNFYRVHPENTSPDQIVKSGLAVVDKVYSGSERLSDSRVTRSEARANVYLIAARSPSTLLTKSDRTHLLMMGVQNHPLSILGVSGAGAVALVFLPSVVSMMKGWIWRLKHRRISGTPSSRRTRA